MTIGINIRNWITRINVIIQVLIIYINKVMRNMPSLLGRAILWTKFSTSFTLPLYFSNLLFFSHWFSLIHWNSTAKFVSYNEIWRDLKIYKKKIKKCQKWKKIGKLGRFFWKKNHSTMDIISRLTSGNHIYFNSLLDFIWYRVFYCRSSYYGGKSLLLK